MGVVYEATDLHSNERGAGKTVRTQGSASRRGFKREFRALQDRRHPTLVTLRDRVEEAGTWVFTRGFAKGLRCRQRVRPRRVLPRAVGRPPDPAPLAAGGSPSGVRPP